LVFCSSVLGGFALFWVLGILCLTLRFIVFWGVFEVFGVGIIQNSGILCCVIGFSCVALVICGETLGFCGFCGF